MLKCSLENRTSYYSSINSFILLEFNNLLVTLWCLIGHYTPSMLIEKNYAPPWDRNVKLIGQLEILMIGRSMRLNFIFNLNCHCFTSVHLWLFLSVRVKEVIVDISMRSFPVWESTRHTEESCRGHQDGQGTGTPLPWEQGLQQMEPEAPAHLSCSEIKWSLEINWH